MLHTPHLHVPSRFLQRNRLNTLLRDFCSRGNRLCMFNSYTVCMSTIGLCTHTNIRIYAYTETHSCKYTVFNFGTVHCTVLIYKCTFVSNTLSAMFIAFKRFPYLITTFLVLISGDHSFQYNVI